MIKNVIFDIGRVLINYEPLDYLKTFHYGDDVDKELAKVIFENPLWNEFDRGTYTLGDCIESMVASAPHHESKIKEVLADGWMDILTLKTESSDFLKKLKSEGYKIYLLSNFSQVGFEYITKKYDFFDYIDGKVVSYEHKLTKPEPEIYDLIIKTYNLVPAETIFIDDNKNNILASQKFGIKTILFENIEDCIKQFETLTK